MEQLRTQPVNFQHPLNRELVSWWLNLPKGRWGGGMKFRDLTRRNDGDVTLSTWKGSQGRPGGWGSLDFASSSDYVVTPSTPSLDITGNITMSMWVKSSVDPPVDNQAGISMTEGGQGNNTHDKGLGIFDTGVGSFYFYDGNTKKANGTTSINDGKWHHIVGIYDGTNGLIYVDGIQEGSVAGSSTFNFTTPQLVFNFVFSGGATAGQYVSLDGAVDDVRIYSRALSAHEVSALYRESKAGYPSALNWLRSPSIKTPVTATGGPFPHYIRRSNALAGGVAA